MRFLFCAAMILLTSVSAMALEPAEVVVVANRFVTGSVDLARYYMEKRGIPKENLLRIDTTNKEVCSRADYEEEIAEPVYEFLSKRPGRGEIRCLVTIFGVPLKVEAPELSREERKSLEAKRQELANLKAQSTGLVEPSGAETEQLQQRIAVLEGQIKTIGKVDQGASVDSELALVLVKDFSLQKWIANPYFINFQQKSLPLGKEDVLLVSRLDGPSMQIVRRIIDDSLAAEAKGLQGIAYFDARAPKHDAQNTLTGYAYYDNSLHLAAERIQPGHGLQVVVNDKPELFKAGEAPHAALYCGWYSLGRYVDAFDWKPGAVGYHIASGECVTLRPGWGNGWCKGMLEDGAAATLGPVAEPYVEAFPVPEVFFSLLTDGYYTLAEAYFLSLPYLSWQMVLVGDPLYRPFKNSSMQSDL